MMSKLEASRASSLQDPTNSANTLAADRAKLHQMQSDQQLIETLLMNIGEPICQLLINSSIRPCDCLRAGTLNDVQLPVGISYFDQAN